MAIKLNETQRALLGAAAQRSDQFFIFPDGRRLVAARRAANALVAAGLAREVRARGEAPIWRHDKDSQCAFALKLTAAGTKAIPAIADDGEGGSKRKPRGEVENRSQRAERPSRGDEKGSAIEQLPASTAAPRIGTKIDGVVKMLSRPEGATLVDLVGGDVEKLDARVVFQAARSSDPAAMGIVDTLTTRLARGIASVISVLDPDLLIIGGGLSQAGGALLDPLSAKVRALVPVAPPMELSTLGDESAALGAVRLALEIVERRHFVTDLSLVEPAGPERKESFVTAS